MTILSMKPTPEGTSLSALHHELIRSLIETGSCPNNSELGRKLDIPRTQIEQLLRKLSEIHGIVLHPHICEPWIVHPFSLTPTMHWITGPKGSWWAPCIWCALGVATLVRGETQFHTRFGAESETLIIRVTDGQPIGAEQVWVHFAIPPASAWQNVHQHCSMVLPFRSPEKTRDWCDRHHLPHGEVVPLHQVARLACLWYGTYDDVDWHKWTTSEAQEIFREAGLVSRFWDLGEKKGTF